MTREYAYAGITIFLWGSSFAVIGLMVKELHPMVMLFFNSLVAFLFLFALNTAQGKLKKGRSGIKKKELHVLVLLGLMTFFYNAMINSSLGYLKAQQSSVINYLWPFFLVIFSCILLKEKMTVWKGLALLISFLGVAIVVTEGNLDNLSGISLPGVCLAGGAAVCYGLFCVINKGVSADNFVGMMLYYLISTVASLIALLTQQIEIPVLTLPQWGGVLWTGVLVYGLSYALWAKALQTGNIAIISNLAYITPVASLVWIYFLMGEKIELFAIAGLLLILIGIAVQIFGEYKKLPGKVRATE